MPRPDLEENADHPRRVRDLQTVDGGKRVTLAYPSLGAGTFRLDIQSDHRRIRVLPSNPVFGRLKLTLLLEVVPSQKDGRNRQHRKHDGAKSRLVLHHHARSHLTPILYRP